mmetsp:Transcript_5885/g.6734  ORF Transcript_5885/g.6734 Transcript_5885/m.6734 type:complete len:96 (+) Transcript_5885:201-488(+)
MQKTPLLSEKDDTKALVPTINRLTESYDKMVAKDKAVDDELNRKTKKVDALERKVRQLEQEIATHGKHIFEQGQQPKYVSTSATTTTTTPLIMKQ